ncbi:hypothetical protein MNBD_GAMMA25-55 [hydrothermal vent metagenome]|uniref:Uncharacterized protein n=1 Tax=hydrothermal vent metagenome TaxID=652676 RepID=A0A3B1B7Q1_9ZZZZ
MQKIVDMSGKPVTVSLRRAAKRALGDCFSVTDKLAISFKPMMTSFCHIEAAENPRRWLNFQSQTPAPFRPMG